MSCADGSLSCGAISTTSSASYTEDDLGLNTVASWASPNNNHQPTQQEKKAVVFNDGEVVLPPPRIGCCAAFPPQCSPCDNGENESSYKADELLMTVVDKEETPDDDEGRVGSVDSSGAFGLMGRDESGRNGMNTKAKFVTTTPKKMNKKVVSPAASPSTTTPSSPKDASSPRTAISSKVFDSAPFRQPQQQLAATTDKPEPISLEGYSIGDEAKLSDFAFNLTKEEAALQAKSLNVGDAAFILRSDRKWTYSIVIDKAVAPDPDDQSALRFEVGADNMRKTFMEGQWGKYIRVITKTSDDKEIGIEEEEEEEIARLPSTVDKDNAAATAAVTKDDDATAISGDPDIQVYDSEADDSDDSDEEDNERDVKPSSLRKKSNLIGRSRSQGSTGSRVHFKLDDATSIKTDTTSNRKQRSGVKAATLDNFFLKKTKVVEKKRNEEGNTEGFSVHFDPFGLGDDGTWTSDKQNGAKMKHNTRRKWNPLQLILLPQQLKVMTKFSLGSKIMSSPQQPRKMIMFLPKRRRPNKLKQETLMCKHRVNWTRRNLFNATIHPSNQAMNPLHQVHQNLMGAGMLDSYFSSVLNLFYLFHNPIPSKVTHRRSP